MDRLKIRKVGNSLGVILPKDVLDQMSLCEGDELNLVKIDGALRLMPFDDEFQRQMEIVSEGLAKYKNTLRALAK